MTGVSERNRMLIQSFSLCAMGLLSGGLIGGTQDNTRALRPILKGRGSLLAYAFPMTKSLFFALAAFPLTFAFGLAAGPASAPVSSKLKIVADLPQRLARWKPVDMPFKGEGLTDRERRHVDKLVEASRQIEQIFWRQSDP